MSILVTEDEDEVTLSGSSTIVIAELDQLITIAAEQQIVPSHDVDTVVISSDPEQTQVDPDGVSIVVQTISDIFPRGDFVFSHGDLTGLTDDDHPQYLTSTRGNNLYTSITHTSLTGNVHGLDASELPGLGAWATEIDAIDKDFILAQMEADAIPSTRIESVVAGKIAAGTMSAKIALAEIFTASIAGSILNDDLAGISIGDPRIDMGYVSDVNNTYVIRHHNGYPDNHASYATNFYVDASGAAYFAGQIVISGGTGITNLSDAGALATRDDITFVQDTEPATAVVGDLWYNTTTAFLYRCDAIGPLEWTIVSNSFDSTSQFTDDANLGGTADWSTVTDDGGRPDDGADVTVAAIEATTTITNGGIILSGGGVIRAGKTSPSHTFPGFWLGWDGATDYDFHIGDSTNSLWWDGSAGTLKIAGQIETAGSGQRIDINPGNDNELHFWGDDGAGTSNIIELATMGISTVDSDDVILRIGGVTSKHVGIDVRSSGAVSAIRAWGYSDGYGAIFGVSTGVAGHGVMGMASTDAYSGVYGLGTKTTDFGVYAYNSASTDGNQAGLYASCAYGYGIVAECYSTGRAPLYLWPSSDPAHPSHLCGTGGLWVANERLYMSTGGYDWEEIRYSKTSLAYVKAYSGTISGSSYLTIAWTAESFDTDDYHDNTTNNTRLVAPRDGFYEVKAQVGVRSAAAGSPKSLVFQTQVNGFGYTSGFYKSAYIPDLTIGIHTMNSSCIMELSAGDYVEIEIFSTIPAILDNSSNQNWASMQFLGSNI